MAAFLYTLFNLFTFAFVVTSMLAAVGIAIVLLLAAELGRHAQAAATAPMNAGAQSRKALDTSLPA